MAGQLVSASPPTARESPPAAPARVVRSSLPLPWVVCLSSKGWKQGQALVGVLGPGRLSLRRPQLPKGRLLSDALRVAHARQAFLPRRQGLRFVGRAVVERHFHGRILRGGYSPASQRWPATRPKA